MEEQAKYIGETLANRIFDEQCLIDIVERTLTVHHIKHTEVWQNPVMPKSIRVYDGAENLIMDIFFTPVMDENLKKTRYIFNEITFNK